MSTAPFPKRHDRDEVDQRCKEVAASNSMRGIAVLENFITGAVDVQCTDDTGRVHVLAVIEPATA